MLGKSFINYCQAIYDNWTVENKGYLTALQTLCLTII